MPVLNLMGHVENPSARIQFLQVAQTTPGQCGICGKGQDKRGFADTQLDFEYWGRLILCADCTLQIGAVFGLISPLDYEELVGERDTAILDLHEANDRILALEKIISGFTDLRAQLHFVSTGTLDNLQADPGEIISTAPIIEPEQHAIQPISESDKPDSKQLGETRKSSGKPGFLNI